MISWKPCRTLSCKEPLSKSNRLYLVEGEFKALSLWESGYPTNGLPGFVCYRRTEEDKIEIYPGILEALLLTEPQEIVFVGDSDTTHNFEFSRSAFTLACELKEFPVLLPRLSIVDAKGIDDYKASNTTDFRARFDEKVRAAIKVDNKGSMTALAATLIEEQLENFQNTISGEIQKRLFRVAARASMKESSPFPDQDRLARLIQKILKVNKASYKKELTRVVNEL